MNSLIIDVGSYAVKFLEIKNERKSIKVVSQQSIPLHKVAPQLNAQTTLEDLQLYTIKNYLENNPFDGKVYFQISEEQITSRFLTLPVGQRRKAEMMIPFQLEENLPFSASQIHTTSCLQKVSNKETKALINITQLESFDQYYEKLRREELVPAVLTTELSWVHSYADVQELEGPLAIVDIGHHSTKCYFIFNKQVVSNHISYVAGEAIDQMISSSYEIPEEDAVIYKHENCFFLTEQQYDEVDEEQSRFAKLMKQTIWPLVLDIKRWEVGFRVKYGHPIEKVLITGGTANINNAVNFFSQALNMPVEIFNPYKDLEFSCNQVKIEEQFTFSLAAIAAKATLSKVRIANFLYGQYTSSFNQNISLHSTAFLFSRSLILCLILGATLLAERFLILDGKEKAMDQRVVNESMLDRSERNIFRLAPERLISKLKRENSQVEQEVRLISSALDLNALSPLVQLSSYLNSNKNIDLIFFRSQDKNVETKFSSESLSELQTMKEFLEKSTFSELFVMLNEDEKTLEANFIGD